MRGAKDSGQGKSQAAFLPSELADFVSRDTYSLLIKGESGSGKTILALTILKTLLPLQNVLYISTRISPLQLMEDYPWIEGIFGPPSTQSQNEMEGWETFVDARLDEPNTVFERITNVLMDNQAPTVVIDSWEALSDVLGGEALRTNIRVLQTWRERAGARFIFIGQDMKNIDIDSMVEGVVLLRERTMTGRRLREMYLSKLHGIKIRKPTHFFTLESGVFRAAPGYSASDYAIGGRTPVKLDKSLPRTREHFSTGYAELDDILGGGYRSNSIASISIGQDVDPRVGMVFVYRVIQDWVASGDTVFLQRPPALEAPLMSKYVKSFAAKKDQIELLKIGDEMPSQPVANRGAGTATTKKRKRLAVLFDGEGSSQSPTAALKSGFDLVIAFSRGHDEGQRSKDAASKMEIENFEGTLFLECTLPWSSPFALFPQTTGGNPTLDVKPVA